MEFNNKVQKPKKDEKLPRSGGYRHGSADLICHRYTVKFKHDPDLDAIHFSPCVDMLDGMVCVDRRCDCK